MGAIALLAERTPLLCAGQGADQVIALAASGGAPAAPSTARPATPCGSSCCAAS